ncbi:MAG: hypothetical protein WDO74_06210 [Pseudomonadota bacterium]
MSRHTRLTVLELGASAIAWASCHALGADDWIVVAQQSDEAAPDFTQRVRKRAQRLRKEDAQIDSVDVYAGPGNDRLSSAARRQVIEELGVEMATGGRLTLWSGSDDARGDAELAAILAQFGPILAERQIAMNHQACESNERSGVRHTVPTRACDPDLEFGELA